MIVPPATPGPDPSAPPISVRPTGRPRLSAGIVVPRVRVIAASMWTSWPAHRRILPSVVVMAWNTRMFWPALSDILPLTVVSGALTITSRPQQATILPFVALIAALMTTSRNAFIVKVVALPDALQAIASLMMISPLPVAVSPGSGIVLIVTLLVTSCADSVAPEMLPPGPTIKSAGSISQLPVRPSGAALVTRAVAATFTVAADVSMEPPLPPPGALASSVPSTFTAPLRISPSSTIRPARLPMVCA